MVNSNANKKKELVVQLFEINAFKFGEFVLKSGILSPVYFDLRVIISHPDVMDTLSDVLMEFTKELGLTYDLLCGVPYTALPIATLLSIKETTPMLIRRKEAKSYGTKKLIEGKFNAGDNCLIVEDVITSGSSILETVADLRNEEIVVADAIVVVDREQGAASNIATKNVKVHSLFTLSFLLNTLKQEGKIDDNIVKSVSNFIASNQTTTTTTTSSTSSSDSIKAPKLNRTSVTYGVRAELKTTSPIARKLFQLMEQKGTNLCVAADLTKSSEILNLTELIGPYICVLKTHVDIIEDFTAEFVQSLMALAKKHNFLLMEDRKFADIGNVVGLQYSKGVYRISEWADLVTVHSLPGKSVLTGLQSVLAEDQQESRGAFLLAELSCEGNLIDTKYSEETMKIAADEGKFVAGIVSQTKSVVQAPELIQLTPGVKIDDKTDGLGQQYFTPEYVVIEKGADIAVVGRGIIKADNVEVAAKLYRDQLWSAYLKRVSANGNQE